MEAVANTSGFRRPARPKSPGIIYGAILAALLVLLTVFALTARQPPPPTIAEFAPQAVEQIQDAPSEQSSQFGSGAGEGDCPPGAECGPGGSGGGAGGGLSAPIDVPRVRKCVGDPPRQIEDPQSPPCVPYWEGDNGGETSKGVTKDEVRIAIPEEGEDDTNEALIKFFNKRFEFYGRELTIVDINKTDGDNPASQKEAAQEADNQNVFASLRWNSSNNLYYYQELARRQIIAVGAWPDFTEEYMQRYHPYLWQYPMGIDRMFMNMGEWGCKRLVGRNAEHAKNPLDQNRERVFGIITQATNDTLEHDISHEPLLRALERCGANVPVVIPKYFEQGDQQKAQNIMIQMKDEEVTSIFCLCHVFGVGFLTKAATSQAYYPEWMTTTYNLMDFNWSIRTFIASDQRQQLFGISFIPRQLDPNDHPSRWAQKEVEGEAPQFEDGFIELARSYKYQHMLLLASGIQMAGPNLTPESFERALHRTVFPNPDHPNMPGKVGFPNEHGMTRDAVEWYWGDSDRSPFRDEQYGTICYLNRGARYSLGRWPTGRAPFFEGPCDSGAR